MSESLAILLNFSFLALIYLLLWQILRAGRRELYPPSPAEEPSARLRRLEGSQVHPIAGRAILGRDPHCSVIVDDGFASARHASIEWDGAGWVLRDLESTNGTLLEGRPVSEARLKDGDVVRIGDTRFRFEC